MLATTLLLYIFSSFVLVAVALPMVHSNYWVFRAFEYPRSQKFVVAAFLALCWIFSQPVTATQTIVFSSLLIAATIYLGVKVFPYTPFCPVEMRSSAHPKCLLSIISGNVLQSNESYHEYMQLLKKHDPDIIFLVETNQKWDEELLQIQEEYPYRIKKIQENTYGMIFLSKLPMVEGRVNFLVEDDVPSVEVTLKLDGQEIQLWGLHPKPPLPDENVRSAAKDKELMKIAFKARETNLPVIVLGDLNDVAWSFTTELFRKTGKLLDPRRGRGFYSTFNAKNWLMRFPLDYIFASTHFSLFKMKRLPPCGSDHFPILTVLNFEGAANPEDEPEASGSDLSKARDVEKTGTVQ